VTPNPPPTQLQRRLRRLTRPLFLFAGVAYVIAGIVKFAIHQDNGWVYIILGVAFLLVAWKAPISSRDA
jgi:hypothetical protein